MVALSRNTSHFHMSSHQLNGPSTMGLQIILASVFSKISDTGAVGYEADASDAFVICRG